VKILPVECPLCSGELVVRDIYCRSCDTTFQGQFSPGVISEFEEAKLPVLRRFALLSPEQLELLESFVLCEGKLNRLQDEVGLSYPTLRARLNEMLSVMGVSPQEEEKTQRVERRQVLDDLATGKLGADEAALLLREGIA